MSTLRKDQSIRMPYNKLNQSQQINSYQKVIEKYEDTLNDKLISKGPHIGEVLLHSIFFRILGGMEHRLNKRTKFSIDEDGWKKVFLQP